MNKRKIIPILFIAFTSLFFFVGLALAAVINVVFNGDFDSDLSGWDVPRSNANGPEFQWIAGRAEQVDNWDSTFLNGGLRQSFTVSASVTQIDVQGIGYAGIGFETFVWIDGPGGICASDSNLNNNNSLFLNASCMSPIPGAYEVVFQGEGVGAWIDDVEIWLTIPNQPPIAVNDDFDMEAGSVLNSNNIMANDSDPDGDDINLLSVDATNLPGVLDVTAVTNSAVFTYTPPVTLTSGSVYFTYIIDDTELNASNPATVTITIDGEPPMIDTLPPGSNPFDLFGSCYICDAPTGFNIADWIAWLACKLSNLFFCALYYWILDVINAILGIFTVINNIVSFFVNLVQLSINWFVAWLQLLINFVVSAWSSLAMAINSLAVDAINSFLASPVGQAIRTFFAYAGLTPALLSTVLGIVIDVFNTAINILIVFIEILMDIFLEIIAAFTAEGSTATIAGVDEATIPELETPGPSPVKIFWITMAAIRTFDTIWGTIPLYSLMTSLIIGIMSIFLIAWTMDKWNEILNF